MPVSEFIKKAFGIGFKEMAKDAKPEEVQAALEELGLTTHNASAAPASGPVFRIIGKTSDGVEVFRSFANDAEAEAEEKKKAEEKG